MIYGIELTKAQQLSNCLLALRLWLDQVTPDMVTKHLQGWRSDFCGTQACFGGWVAQWPEFAAMGVRAGTMHDRLAGYNVATHEPCMPEQDLWDGHDVAEYLFGDARMFEIRPSHSVDGSGYNETFMNKPGLTDWQVVEWRLKQRIEELTKEIEHGSQQRGTPPAGGGGA